MKNPFFAFSKFAKSVIALALLIGLLSPISSNAAVGDTWNEATAAGARQWYQVASSASGIKLAAVVNGGYIYTSTDSGATWTERTNSGSGDWMSIASSSDGTKLVASRAWAGNGSIYTSTDSGATWVERTSVGSRRWFYVTSSDDGTKLAAVDGNTSTGGYIYTSTDSGATWTEQTASGQRQWKAISSSSNGSKLAAIVSTGQIYTSTDSGATWTARDSNRNWQRITSSSDGTKLAATVLGGYIYTSANSGATWTAATAAGTTNNWFSITSSSDGTKLAAGGGHGDIYVSSDSGGTWTVSAAGDKTWQSLASNSDGTKLVGVTYGGYIYVTPAIYNSGTGSGVVHCGTSGFFTITSNVVTGSTLCQGSAAVPSGVTSIGAQVFEGSSVSSISIPATVTTIGAAAFRAATSLTSATFASGSTLTSIGSAAFERTAIATITLPATLTFLGNYAFWSNAALTSIVIPDGITGILLNTFENATSLTSVTLPNSLTLIQADAFKGATSLSTLVIPNLVTSIGAAAFTNTNLTSGYNYCGTASNTILTNAGLGSFTRGNCASQSIDFPALGNKALGETAPTLSAVASSTLAVTYTSTTIGFCTVSGSTITMRAIGTCSITASQIGTGSISPATSVTRTFSISTPNVEPAPTPAPPPPSFLKVKTAPTISLTSNNYTCDAGSLIFWRYSVTEEPSKISNQKISLLRDGTEVASSETLKATATFEKNSSWTGSTMTCQIYAAQENTVGTFSSLGADKYNELSKIKAAATKAAEAKYFTDRKAAYDTRRVDLSRISNEKANELKVAKTSAQVKAAAEKYRLAMARISQTWKADVQAAPARRDSSIALAQATFIQELAKYGLSIIQP